MYYIISLTPVRATKDSKAISIRLGRVLQMTPCLCTKYAEFNSLGKHVSDVIFENVTLGTRYLKRITEANTLRTQRKEHWVLFSLQYLMATKINKRWSRSTDQSIY